LAKQGGAHPRTLSRRVTGSPGSGKSAVFAQLHHELGNDRATVLLANAAGCTQRGSNVNAMLRRWIAELA